ncbi:MAG: hypothetical protein AB1778_10310 [Candidatus Bipolaricaulota bacterium]
MRRGTLYETKRFVVHVCVKTATCVDSGVGVVLCTRPLFIAVPSHLVVQLEDDRSAGVLIDGELCELWEILPSSVLSAEHLTVLRVLGLRGGRLNAVRLPRRPVPLPHGSQIRILGCGVRSLFEHLGHVAGRGPDSPNPPVVTDVAVQPGCSGSALLAGRRLVGICQGMIPWNGNVAVAFPLTGPMLTELTGIQRRCGRVRRALLGVAAVAALGVLGLVAFSCHELPRIRVLVPTQRTVWIAGNRERIWWETRNVSTDPSVLLDIHFSSDGGRNWTPIAPASNDGSEPWSVPVVSSTQCLLRFVLRSDRSVQGVSSQFTIVPP